MTSITQTIIARWDELSATAQAHILRTRPQLDRQWELREEGYHYTTIEAEDAKEALSIATGAVDGASYSVEGSTIWVDVEVRHQLTGDSLSATVPVHPDVPECTEGRDDHDWQVPFSVLGGLSENPGVWGHGGGVIVREVCAHCGRYRETDTWAQRPSTGEQGLTSIRYEEADAASLAWVASCAD